MMWVFNAFVGGALVLVAICFLIFVGSVVKELRRLGVERRRLAEEPDDAP